LVGEERGRIVVFTKGFPREKGGFDHGYVVGPEDKVEDLENARRDEGGILGRFLDQRGENTESYLHITTHTKAMP
jgi:hypothetical protein